MSTRKMRHPPRTLNTLTNGKGADQVSGSKREWWDGTSRRLEVPRGRFGFREKHTNSTRLKCPKSDNPYQIRPVHYRNPGVVERE